MKAKEISLEEKYEDLMERYAKLQEENRILQENYRPRVSNDNQYEIIKRLDIIGNMLGRYIRDKALKESKQKLDEIKKEYDYLTFDYNSREMCYDNDYETRLKIYDESERCG